MSELEYKKESIELTGWLNGYSLDFCGNPRDSEATFILDSSGNHNHGVGASRDHKVEMSSIHPKLIEPLSRFLQGNCCGEVSITFEFKAPTERSLNNAKYTKEINALQSTINTAKSDIDRMQDKLLQLKKDYND